VFVGEYILTAAHCASSGMDDGSPQATMDIRIRVGNFGLSNPVPGLVVHFDPIRDVAVVVAAEVLGPHAQVPLATRDPETGDPVIVVGHPRGMSWTVTTGVATGVRPDTLDGQSFLQVSAQAAPGNSGGPVFNEFGEVVGMVVAGMDSHLVFCVPLEALRGALER
jgi:S1-C subfamily serine protease